MPARLVKKATTEEDLPCFLIDMDKDRQNQCLHWYIRARTGMAVKTIAHGIVSGKLSPNINATSYTWP